MSFNTAKIINVYYKADRKPYDANGKPISYFGEDFIGSNEATQIRFYMPNNEDLGAVDCIVDVKRPNGDKRFDLLTKVTPSGEAPYYRLMLNDWYSAYVGKVTIAFRAFQGSVTIVDGVITSTSGAIYVSDIFHLQISYAPNSTVEVPPFDSTDWQNILFELSSKLDVANGIFVITSQIPTDYTDIDALTGRGIYDGQWFLVKNNTNGELGRLYYVDNVTIKPVELELDTLKLTPTGNGDLTTNTGKLNWEQPNGTIQMGLYNDVNVGLGEDVFYYGKASANVLKGQAIQFAGYQGDHILIKPAVPSEINANPKLIMGIAKQDIANGDFGYVLAFGKLDGFDSGSFSAGNLLWFASGSGSNGVLTATQPTAPNAKILMAAVIKAETSGPANNGVIQVRITIEPKISELQDVFINLIEDTQILRYNSANGRFENSGDLTLAEQDIDSLEGRMNTAETDIDNLEVRMDGAEQDIDDIEDGTTIVPKALADQNGDTINTTYLKVATASSTYVPLSQKGANNGVAPLDGTGKIPSIHLPGGVDDIKEFDSLEDFPETGEASIIYVALDTNIIYRWSGSAYVEISSSLALGETSSTAFAGNRGVALETLTTNIVNGTQSLALKDQVIRNTAVGTIPLTINGVASTTANLTEFQVDGTKVLEVTKDGFLFRNGTRLFTQPTANTTFFGLSSGGNSTSGTHNTGFGVNALALVTSGNSNTAVGVSALVNTSTGSSNTTIGRDSGNSLTTGSNNTFVGRSAGENASQLATAANSTALGYQAYTDKSNQMVFGNGSVSEFVFNRNTGALVLLPQVTAIASIFHTLETTTTETSTSSSQLVLRRTTTGDMVDGFGAGVSFFARDNSNVDNALGFIGMVRSGADNSGRLRFFTNNAGSNTEKMTILPSGNVGIGTTSPINNLSVNGNMSFVYGSSLRVHNPNNTNYTFPNILTNSYDNGILNDNLKIEVAGTGSSYINFFTRVNAVSTERMRISSNGNVGIGTTSPASLLHIQGSSTGNIFSRITNTNTAGYSFLTLGDTTTKSSGLLKNGSTQSSYGGNNALSLYNFDNEPISFVTSNLLRAIITGDGNVGIGTTSPSAKLQVQDVASAGITSNLRLVNNASANPAGEGTRLLFANNSGFVAADVNSAAITSFLTNPSNGGSALYFSTWNGSTLAETMRITETGNIGINETNPGGQLTIKSAAIDKAPLIVNTLAGQTAVLQVWQVNGTGKAEIDIYGSFGGQAIYNINNLNNALIQLLTEGTEIRRNVADTNPALIVNLQNSSATGNIQVWQKAGVASAWITNGGGAVFNNNVAISGGFLSVTGNTYLDGLVGINETTLSAQLQVKSGATNRVPLIIDTIASHTADLQVWQKAGSALSQINNNGVFVGQSRPSSEEQTGDYTLAIADEGKVIRVNSGSNRTITIPLNSGTAIPIGAEIAILRYGTGTVSISPTSGVTLNSKNSERKISGQYASVALKKIGTDEWVLVGSLEA